MFAELIGEPTHFERAHDGHHPEQQQNTTADQEWYNLLIGLHRNDDGANGNGGGRQCNAGQADAEIAGVDGHECVVVESRKVIGRDRFVAERIGHACFLATVGRIRSSARRT